MNDQMFNDLIHQPDFKSIIDWIDQNPDFFFEKVKNRLGRDAFTLSVTYLYLRYYDQVSNSHAAPRGGVTNWSSVSDKPRGYPGWHGRIEFSLTSCSMPGSDLFRSIGIHTGSGGCINGKQHGYSVSMFASDWPGVASQITMCKLADIWPESFIWGVPNYFA